MKNRLRKFLCWWKHDWTMSKNIRTACETDDGTTYIYERRCSRDGCGFHQEISICNIKGFGRIDFLEKEWVSQ